MILKITMGLFFILCMGMGARQPVRVVTPLPPEVVVDTLEPIEGNASKSFLTGAKCNGCSVAQSDRVAASILKVNEVIASQCFKDKLSSLPLIQTNGRTPLQVVEHLTSSNVVVGIEMYYTFKRVSGYTLPKVNKIWLNTKYLMVWGACDTGSLLAHEASHKTGYDHDYSSTPRRPNSVPYSINKAFTACCKR